MKDRITKREDALLDFNTPPKENYVDQVLEKGIYKDFSRVLNEASALPHVTQKMADLYQPIIDAFDHMRSQQAQDIQEKLVDIKMVDIKFIHNEVTMVLSDEFKKLLPKELHAPILAVIKQAAEFAFDAIYTPTGSYQPDFVEFMNKSFNKPYCLPSMERYCEVTGQSLERALVSSAGLYIATPPVSLSVGGVMANIFSSNLLDNTVNQYTQARFDIIHKKAEKTALKKVCADLEAHFLTQKDSPHTQDKLQVLDILKKQLDIKGFAGLKAFADYYQQPSTLNILRKGSDNLTLTVLKAVGEMLASVLSLGVYAAYRAHQSDKQFGTKQFWLTPDQVLDKQAQKQTRDIADDNTPPAKKPKR